MLTYPGITPVDYLVIGHITQDITPQGRRPGGTAAFAALTARALGQRVGVVTSWAEESGKELFENIEIANLPCESSTTFENIYTKNGRMQKVHHLAPELGYYHIPESWRSAKIVHLGPVAKEVSPNIVQHFKESDVYLTPQGWMRQWDREGHVRFDYWLEAAFILQQARAAVISEEDVQKDQSIIYSLASSVPVLAVTKGNQGVDLYAEGSLYSLSAPETQEVDPTGAGDIFAATFFTQYTHPGDPRQAAEFAIRVASNSIKRPGLSAAPTEDTLYQLSEEVF